MYLFDSILISGKTITTSLPAMPRRHVLEDSDSESSDDDNGGVSHGKPASSATKDDIASIFTAEETEAIQRCNLKLYATDGFYSEECMSRLIERLMEESPIELVAAGQDLVSSNYPSHEQYRAKIGEEKVFFKRDIYNRHNPNSARSGRVKPDTSYFEEEILFEIELLRRSEKALKNRMFKNKETGGMVVFGPWWNYAFRRLLELPLSNNISAESLGNYTAVKIIQSLFHFITHDLNDIVKSGKLSAMKNAFGVDWLGNITTARKVVNQCGTQAHFLDKELSVVEAHVESIRKKSKPVSLIGASASVRPTPIQDVTGTVGRPSKPDQDNARKARLAAMRKDAMRSAPPPVKDAATGAQPGDRNSSSGGPAVHSGVDSVGWGRKRDAIISTARSNSGGQVDTALNELPQDGASNSSGCDNDGWGRQRAAPNTQPRTAGEQSNERHSSLEGQVRSTFDRRVSDPIGWGRNRDKPSEIIEPKSSFGFARQILNYNVALPESEVQVMNRNLQKCHAPSHGGGRDDEYEGQGSNRYNATPRRYDDDRSYHRGSSRDGEREDHLYNESRSTREDYRGSITDFNNEYSERRKRGWDPERNDGVSRPEKFVKRMTDTIDQPVVVVNAAATLSGSGRGRGAHVNKPAWMTKQEKSSANDRTFVAPGRGDSMSSNATSYTSVGAPLQAESHAQQNANTVMVSQGNGQVGMNTNNHFTYSVAQPNRDFANNVSIASGDTASSANPLAMNTTHAVDNEMQRVGRGRGRGASRNLPAWMTNPTNL